MADKETEKNGAAAQGPSRADAPPAGARRGLLLMRAGPHALAVLADESDGAVAFARATPLPFAPPAVLGVISARGRMRTVIDPRPLLRGALTETRAEGEDDERPRHAVLLRGDEQLALAVSHVGETIEIDPDEIQPAEPPQDFARGTFTYENSVVVVLHPAKLFDAAAGDMGRRRRRR